MKIAKNRLLTSIGVYMFITTDTEMAYRMCISSNELSYYYLMNDSGKVVLSTVVGGCTNKISRFRCRTFKQI